MSGFRVHTGIAAPLRRDNIDTDQIIPSREMKTVSKLGLGEGLFAGQRYVAPGSREENPDFILNRSAFKGASILLSGKNFGCGSSREHAVWALKDYGIRAVIAESFGEIFFNNCLRNGILPLPLTGAQIDSLEGKNPVTIDLPAQHISVGKISLNFAIDHAVKDGLIKGLDPIDITLESLADIDAFLARDKAARPWVYEVSAL